MKIPSFDTYPEAATFQQRLHSCPLRDLTTSVRDSLSALPIWEGAAPGDTVAVAVGSRGIQKVDAVVLSCIEYLKNKGLKPFIVPAMGSHGGATPEGQMSVLEKIGITQSGMGVPIIADMDVDCIGNLPEDLRLYFSKSALSADHVVAVNRIKPHTKFEGDIESGLCKMLTIGLGKEKGAAEFHQHAVRQSFSIIETAAEAVLKTVPFLFGLALVEDGCGDLSHIEAVSSSGLISREKELLKKATKMMARIPFDFVDILIVDVFGKDISGIGMDPNVTGRLRDIVGDLNTSPHPKRIFVRDLSPGSGGNANGIGLADVITTRLANAIDLEKTYINAVTAISVEKASIPMHFENDRTCLDVCFHTIGRHSIGNARVVRIKDTRSLEYIQVSRAFENEIESNSNLKQMMPWAPLTFDENGNLADIETGR